MYASLEELRKKIGHVVKCAFRKSKLAWYNLIAKRCQKPTNRHWRLAHAELVTTSLVMVDKNTEKRIPVYSP
jgi:hypothetical protein